MCQLVPILLGFAAFHTLTGSGPNHELHKRPLLNPLGMKSSLIRSLFTDPDRAAPAIPVLGARSTARSMTFTAGGFPFVPDATPYQTGETGISHKDHRITGFLRYRSSV